MDPNAFNYNEEANTDDGNCIPYVYGCIDSTALNYDPFANTYNYECEFGEVEIIGCMDPNAFNYNEEADTDDGNCIPYVYGCIDSTAFNYNVSANTDDGSCIDPIVGCTNEFSPNYNADANVDDGSCIDVVVGCTDINAINYDPFANIDDGSCSYDNNNCIIPPPYSGGVTGVSHTGLLLTSFIQSLNVSSDSAYILVSTLDGKTVGSTCVSSSCLDAQVQTSITIWGDDTFTTQIDGATEGAILNVQLVDGIHVQDLSVTYMGASDLVYQTNGIAIFTSAIVESSCYYDMNVSCTDSSACNYNSEATSDDGSCLFFDDCRNVVGRDQIRVIIVMVIV